MIKQLKFTRFLAMIYFGTGMGVGYFWYLFFSEALFADNELAKLLPKFQHYHAWLSGQALLEAVLAFLLFVCGVVLWFDLARKWREIPLSLTAGLAAYLGISGMTQGINSGLYQVDRAFAGLALEVDLSIAVVAVLSSLYICRSVLSKQ